MRAWRQPARSRALPAKSAVATGSARFNVAELEDGAANGLHVQGRPAQEDDHPVGLREAAGELFLGQIH